LPDQFTQRLELFSTSASTATTPAPNPQTLLKGLKRGIEKESLRITLDGKLAQTPHPSKLGSALTHPYITTDFSEALMELITPVSTSIAGTLELLDNTHRFVYTQLDNELLWTSSMPCILEGDEQIPVAVYGSSNVATMKTAYRHGLGNRYGRLMQTIAGIHYNFSLPEDMWRALQQQDYDKRPLQHYITDSYFDLIRNFRRFSWLLIYLYGASPAVCKTFLRGRNDHQLEEFGHGTVYMPYGTALRMGNLGYQSSAQENLKVCYNSIDSYINTLGDAITGSHPDYEKIGIKDGDHYRQLSTALLQIENEFYSPIRPKRVTDSGETPLSALSRRGVEYIEVRCIDVNPYLPLGIDADQIRFLDCFLLFCLFDRSPMCDDDDRCRINSNLKAIVNYGRQPGLQLQSRSGEYSLQDWGTELLNGIDKIAVLLDAAHGGEEYQRVCREQRQKLSDPSLTPSAKILADMRDRDLSFFSFSINQSEQHAKDFMARPLTTDKLAFFQQITQQSLLDQAAVEASDTQSFDDYLAAYYSQYQDLL